MKEQAKRLKGLTLALKAMAAQTKKGDTLSHREQQQLVSMDAEARQIQTLLTCEHDVAQFAYEYFSDERNPANGAGNVIRHAEDGTPHETITELSAIHQDFYDICGEITTKRKGKYCVCSPRGHAKSSVMSVILTLHELVYQKRQYVIIISETDTLSKRLLASIATQLRYNEKLRQDFGELLHDQANKNERDNEDSFITTTKALVEASSAGKSLRGKTYNNIRPQLVIADDVSSLQNEATEEQRQKLINWWNTVIEPMPAGDAALVFVGTKVTATGLIADLMKRRAYKRVLHGAILREPDNPTLWSDYLHLYTSDNDDETINDFYEANREQLEAGVELAWPKRWTYRELMEVKASIGGRAFASEYMNQSFASDEQHFSPDDYGYARRVFDGNGRAEALVYAGKYYYLRDMDKIGCWDPALAGKARSALNAYVTLGRHKDSGLVFVIDVYASREVPSEFMPQILTRLIEYKPHKIVVEGIGAYRAYADQLGEHMRHNAIYHTRLETLKTHGMKSKASRIEALEIPLANKSLILNEANKEVTNELRNYPNGVVDVLDAIEMAFNTSRKRVIQLQQKPAWL